MKYKLVKQVPTERYYEITIVADENDGDYLTEAGIYSQSDFEEIVDELINLMDNYSGGHKLEKYNDEVGLLPYGEYGCHTLASVDIKMYDTDGFVYDVLLQLKENKYEI